MRALPIGWVLPHDQAERRRQVRIAMSRATHADPAALVAACVIAACASWALENASPSMLLSAAAEEAREAAQAVTTEARLAEMLTQLSAGTWELPANGISLDPYETVAAVLWCAARATSLCNGLVSAVQLGGDTDTVAALVGGLMGCKLTAEQVRAELPWHQLPNQKPQWRRPRRAGNYPYDPVRVRPGRLVLRGHSPSVPDVAFGEPRSPAYLVNATLPRSP
jgi:ADP-ribosylglycohydrolase